MDLSDPCLSLGSGKAISRAPALHLSGQINPLGNALICSFLYILADELYQICQRHHGTAYHEIEKLLFLLAPAMAEGYVLQPDRLGHGLSHLDFFPDAVYQMEMGLRE